MLPLFSAASDAARVLLLISFLKLVITRNAVLVVDRLGKGPLVCGGVTRMTLLEVCYFRNTRAIIYTVDSSGADRLVTAKDEVHVILEKEELKGAVVLVLANKQDLPGAVDDAAITKALELHKMKNRQLATSKRQL